MAAINSNSKCVEINGIPYPKNSLRVSTDADLFIVVEHDRRHEPLVRALYSGIVLDGGVAANEAAVFSFIKEHFFCCGGGGGEVETETAMIKEITITEETLELLPIPVNMNVYDIHAYHGDANGGGWYQPIVSGANLDLSDIQPEIGDKIILYGEKAA